MFLFVFSGHDEAFIWMAIMRFFITQKNRTSDYQQIKPPKKRVLVRNEHEHDDIIGLLQAFQPKIKPN
jgi:hypothetical protein